MFGKAYFNSRWINLALAILFIVYCGIMADLLFFRMRSFGGHVSEARYSYNLVPLHTMLGYAADIRWSLRDAGFRNFFGNIVLFVPIGLFVPLLHMSFMRAVPLTLLTVSAIGAAELTQMLSHAGSFDVDDILLNTAGAWIGLTILRTLLRGREENRVTIGTRRL